jgi:alanine racemase
MRAEALVDHGAIQDNTATLASRLDGAALCAVVKADAYGHGIIKAGRAALRGGADWLAVATASEAVDLGFELAMPARSLVLGAIKVPEELDQVFVADADVAVWTRDFLEAVETRFRDTGKPPMRVHVKYDTGMGRMGESDPQEVAHLARTAAASPHVELAGIWTHFATADEDDPSFFERQFVRFRELAVPLRDELGGPLLHAANSAATLREPEAHFDMVRCGIAIYGLDPFGRDPAEHGLRPALALRSYVAHVKRFEAGDSAGYGRVWKAGEPTWVGVVPIGYGDGVRRGLSNNADVLIGGRRYPVVGTISMDNLTVNLGPDPQVEVGDEVVLIGSQGSERILAEELATRLDTINYEITCGISPRVPRKPARDP